MPLPPRRRRRRSRPLGLDHQLDRLVDRRDGAQRGRGRRRLRRKGVVVVVGSASVRPGGCRGAVARREQDQRVGGVLLAQRVRLVVGLEERGGRGGRQREAAGWMLAGCARSRRISAKQEEKKTRRSQAGDDTRRRDRSA